MKLQMKKVARPAYEPKVLEVTFETLVELVLFRKLMGANNRVPNMLTKDGDILHKDAGLLMNIMGDIYTEVSAHERKLEARDEG